MNVEHHHVPLLRCQKYVSHFQISIFGQRQGDILAIIFDFTNFFSHLSELYTIWFYGPLLKKELEKNLFYRLNHMYYHLFYLFGILDILKIRQCGGFSLGFVHCGGQHNPPNHLLVEPRCYHGDGGNYTGR